jgi:hypothetical protein
VCSAGPRSSGTSCTPPRGREGVDPRVVHRPHRRSGARRAALVRRALTRAAGHVDWRPFDHPQLGPVELGGWDDLSVWTNPPLHLAARRGDTARGLRRAPGAVLTPTRDPPHPRRAGPRRRHLAGRGRRGEHRLAADHGELEGRSRRPGQTDPRRRRRNRSRCSTAQRGGPSDSSPGRRRRVSRTARSAPRIGPPARGSSGRSRQRRSR